MFGLENGGQGQEENMDLHHLTGNIRFYIDDFFQNFSNPAKRLRKLEHTCIHTYTGSEMGMGHNYKNLRN